MINPELEIWVWAQSPHCLGCSKKSECQLGSGTAEVPRLLGMDWEGIKNLGHQMGYWQEDETKPSRPKELLLEVLRRTGKRRSARLYQQLAQKVGLKRCRDSSFRRFCEVLQAWFPA